MARKRLYKRFSKAVRQFDSERRIFESLTLALDDSFDRVNDKIRGLHELRSIDDIPDKFLPQSSDNVGHIWRTDNDYTWNRRRQKEAKIRASYKGSDDCIGDLIREHGGRVWFITDMASRLDIWNRQGGWNRSDGIALGAKLFHPGAYMLEVDEEFDFDAFLIDFMDIRRAGSTWFFIRAIPSLSIIEEDIWTLQFESGYGSREITWPRWNTDLFWNDGPAGSDFTQGIPVNHMGSVTDGANAYEDPPVWNGMPAGSEYLQAIPVDHLYSDTSFDYDIDSRWFPSGAITLSNQEGYFSQGGTLETYLWADSTLPIDTPGLKINMGGFDTPLTEPYSLLQYASELVTEETL